MKSLVGVVNKGLGTVETTEGIVSLIKELTKSEALDKLTSFGMDSAVANNFANMAKCIDDVADASNVASKSTGTLMDGFRGAGTKIASFFTSPAGIVTALTAAFAGLVTYMNYAGHSFTRLQDDFNIKASAYDDTKAEVESLNSELQTTQSRIYELNQLQANGGLTFAEESELDTLTQTNVQLERQLALKQSMLEMQAKSQANAAVKASNEKMSDTEIVEKETGMSGWMYNLTKWASKIGGISTPLPGLESAIKNMDTSTEGMLQHSIDSASRLKSELQTLEDDYISAANSGDEKKAKKIQKQIETTSNAYAKATQNIGSYADTISGWIEASTDESGRIEQGYEQQVRGWKDMLTTVQNIGKTQSQILDNNLKNYFDGSDKSFIIGQLQDMAENGTLTSESVKGLGLNLADAGLKAHNVANYFNQMAESAKRAASESEGISNGLNVDDVKTAFDSKNAGDNYVSMNDYIKKAKELYDQGLTGTDEFKSVGEFLSYDKSKGNVDAFIRDYETVKRYFTEDDKGNLTAQGMNNFLTDLQSKGQEIAQNNPAKNYANEWAVWDEQAQKWTLNMDNTAEAANELGISVQSMEAILGRLKDYDNAGDINFKSALEDFSSAQQSLKGLQEIYDSMDSGNGKKKELELKLDKWEEQISLYENDLASLDDEFVVQIRLEYDLASIQQKIDEMNNVINEKGEANASVDQLAERNAAQSTWLQTATEQLGLNTEGVQVPVELANIDEQTNNLRGMLSQLSGEDLIQAQIAISNLQETKQELVEAFMEENPEVNIESNTDDINTAWNTFMESAQAKEITAKITADTTDAESKIDALKQQEVEDIVVSLVGEDRATPVMYLWNSLNADPKFASLSAQDQATYMIDYWNGLSFEDKTSVLSSILQAEDNATPTIGAVDGAVGGMKLDPTVSIGASDGATGTINSVSASLFALNGKTATTYIHTIRTSSGKDKLSGTAHANGTAGLYPIPKLSGRALAMGTLSDDSWLKPSWRTKKSEVALTGEEGQELVATRANRWFTVGDNGAEFASIPQGSIVFNAKQTEELFKNGKINSRGKSYTSGTAYAGGASGGFQFSGGAAKYNPPNSTPIESAADSLAEAASNVQEAAEETKETFNWVAVAVDRIERSIKRVSLIAESSYKNFTARNDALNKQISETVNSIQFQKNAYDTYMNKANSVGLDQVWKNHVNSGAFNISDITDENLSKQIKEYQDWYEKALDAKDAIEELKESVSELYEQSFNNLSDQFDNVLGQIEHKHNMLEGYIDQSEAKGYLVSKKYYEALIQADKNTLGELSVKRNRLSESLNSAVNSGNIQEYSDAWYEMKSEINDTDEAIQDANTSILEYGKSLRELSWDAFDRIQESISSITGESDFLIKLMSSKDLYDDDGNITDDGKATMGLHGVNYNTHMSQADEYANEIKSIQEELSTDPYNQDLIERRKELLELQQESILAAEDEKDAIRDLIENGIDKQLDSLSKLIDEYTEALDSQKDLYDYQKKMQKYQDEISSVEKQLTAYANDDSEEGRAKRQQLQNSLKDAKGDLEDAQYDKSIAEQKKLLDELYTEYETVLNMRLDNIDQLITDVVDNVNAESSAIRDTIQSSANSVGYQLTDTMASIWGENGSLNKIITTYGDNFISSITGVQNAINSLKSIMEQYTGIYDSEADSNINGSTESVETPTKPQEQPSTPEPEVKSEDTNFFISKDDYYPKNLLNTETSIIDRLKYHNFDSGYDARAMYYGNMGLPGGYVSSYDQNVAMLDWMKIKGFKKGTKSVPKDGMYLTDEKGKAETIIEASDGTRLRHLNQGDMVLNHGARENFYKLMNEPVDFIKNITGNTKLPNIASDNSSTISNDIQFNVNIDKVQDYNDLMRQMQKDNKFEKFIQAMTVDRIAGGSRLAKHKINF